MDPSRKCFRLVGGVLVERSVDVVLPGLVSNKDKVGIPLIQLGMAHKSVN